MSSAHHRWQEESEDCEDSTLVFLKFMEDAYYEKECLDLSWHHNLLIFHHLFPMSFMKHPHGTVFSNSSFAKLVSWKHNRF